MFLAANDLQTDRAYPRSRVLMTGTLMTRDGAVRVRIRDISVAGAQIWAESPVPAEGDAILKRGPFFAAAKIVWRNDRTLGLQFYRLLSDEEFASAFEQQPSTTFGLPVFPQPAPTA